MMRRQALVVPAAVVLLCGFALTCVATDVARADALPTAGNAISLRVLQQQLESCGSQRTPSAEAMRLGGITKLYGYVVDHDTHDVVLFGEADPSAPPLHTDDFVVALRNAWLRYAETRDYDMYYSYPGCSIDPDSAVIRVLQHLANRIGSTASIPQFEEMLREWKTKCSQPQQVRVMGVPFDTRFASVMVEADYDMKTLVDGSDDSLNVDGFRSLLDATMDEAKRQLTQGTQAQIPLSAMNRFWFHPGESSYFADSTIVAVLDCPVVLRTEEEHLAGQGGFIGSGRASPLASQFCGRFSRLYDQVAEQRPIYADLGNLFRLVAVSQFMKERNAPSAAGLDLTYLLEGHPVDTTGAPRSLPGRSNVMRFTERQTIPGGYSDAYIWLPSCGGVSIEYDPRQAKRAQDARTREQCLDSVKQILMQNPGDGSVSWGWEFLGVDKTELDGGERRLGVCAILRDTDGVSARQGS